MNLGFHLLWLLVPLLFQTFNALEQFANDLVLLQNDAVVILLNGCHRVIHTLCKFGNMLIMIGVIPHRRAQCLCGAQMV